MTVNPQKTMVGIAPPPTPSGAPAPPSPPEATVQRARATCIGLSPQPVLLSPRTPRLDAARSAQPAALEAATRFVPLAPAAMAPASTTLSDVPLEAPRVLAILAAIMGVLIWLATTAVVIGRWLG